ncbi:MAG: HlyD family type I secretion periplasmic adaptor subunit [Alphaproteobacteria bacterium]|nr:MAG: HlyD family type I secretion periplasmic adaptor subunit [Alphaproteobacteria bacterium]
MTPGAENLEHGLPVAPARAANILLWTVTGAVLLLVLWAALARIDEVTRGIGRVIPSQQLQVVQNLEGGIVEAILVKQGQEVRAGDVLLRLDNTQFNAAFLQGQEGFNALSAKIARLEAEVAGTALTFDAALEKGAPVAVATERALYAARRAEMQAALNVRQSQWVQRRQSLQEAEVAIATAEQNEALAVAERDMLAPLVEKGIEPQIELLRARQRVATAQGEARAAKLAAARAAQAVEEAKLEIQAVKERYRSAAAQELADAKTEMAALVEELPALRDRVSRTEVKAAIDGVVSRVLVNTVGGVVKPGEPLVEIVPRDDSLLIEAEISPADIAFLRAGQRARVKLTAYDYRTYGAMNGRLEYISPDAIENDNGQRVYLVHVRTDSKTLSSKDGDLPIIPGMVAEVDVLNGKRSVLDYILKPLSEVRDKALREG